MVIVDRTQFKQRIVGAIVLVALGVIFIPMILNQDADVSPISGTNIPEKPEKLQELANQQPPATPARPDVDTDRATIVDRDLPPPPPAPSVSSSNPESDKVVADKPATTEAPVTASEKKKQESKVTEKTETKPRAWVVQVASFSERSKALTLRDRLRKAKYTTFVESISTAKGLLYRVRVGPVVKREKAEELKKKIARDLKIKNTLVMSHP